MTTKVRLVAAAFAGLIVVAAAAGCSEESPFPLPVESPPASPFELCPTTGPGGATTATDPVPDLTLPCFTGGAPVALARLRTPAIINLWASSCEPCREEMPALQAFADEMGDRLLVLGVNTGDTWTAGAWIGIDFGVRFPSVFDPDRTLLTTLGRMSLPVTLFVAEDGSVRGTDISGSLTLDELRTLTVEHLGIGV